jgi:LAGLIDADG DNA endonuclease family protein
MSDNPHGADNQQESLSPEWVVGFVDGEGCFYVGINRQPTMKVGWQVLPEFRVVQHQRDVALLDQLGAFFGCGQVTVMVTAWSSASGDSKSCRNGWCHSSDRIHCGR